MIDNPLSSGGIWLNHMISLHQLLPLVNPIEYKNNIGLFPVVSLKAIRITLGMTDQMLNTLELMGKK